MIKANHCKERIELKTDFTTCCLEHLATFVSFDISIYKEEDNGTDFFGDYTDEQRC